MYDQKSKLYASSNSTIIKWIGTHGNKWRMLSIFFLRIVEQKTEEQMQLNMRNLKISMKGTAEVPEPNGNWAKMDD